MPRSHTKACLQAARQSGACSEHAPAISDVLKPEVLNRAVQAALAVLLLCICAVQDCHVRFSEAPDSW